MILHSLQNIFEYIISIYWTFTPDLKFMFYLKWSKYSVISLVYANKLHSYNFLNFVCLYPLIGDIATYESAVRTHCRTHLIMIRRFLTLSLNEFLISTYKYLIHCYTQILKQIIVSTSKITCDHSPCFLFIFGHIILSNRCFIKNWSCLHLFIKILSIFVCFAVAE